MYFFTIQGSIELKDQCVGKFVFFLKTLSLTCKQLPYHRILTRTSLCLCLISSPYKDPNNIGSEVKSLSHVRLFSTLWTVAHQAPPSMEFSRQESWSRLPFLSPGDLPDSGIKPGSPTLQADAFPSEPSEKPNNQAPT